MECIWYTCISMKINDSDLEFNEFLAVFLRFNRKWYSIIWNQFELSKLIINMPVIKLSSIHYLEVNYLEWGLPSTLALLKCNIKASSSWLSLDNSWNRRNRLYVLYTYWKKYTCSKRYLILYDTYIRHIHEHYRIIP